MGFYSEIWIEVIELAEQGYTPEQITNKVNTEYGYALLTVEQIEDCIDEYVQDTKECV